MENKMTEQTDKKLREYRVTICYDGAVCVKAATAEDAREQVCSMAVDEMYRNSDGCWDIGEAEELEEQ